MGMEARTARRGRVMEKFRTSALISAVLFAASYIQYLIGSEWMFTAFASMWNMQVAILIAAWDRDNG